MFATSMELIELKIFSESIKSLLQDSKKKMCIYVLNFQMSTGRRKGQTFCQKAFKDFKGI